MTKKYGWPEDLFGDFKDYTRIDDYHKISSLDYPEAYNFAGQHSIAGHELVHGFDDEALSVAQKRMVQYNVQMVRRHKEKTLQILEFLTSSSTFRLPGLERFSHNQLFWIVNGFGWCESSSEKRLIRQLLTDVHSPHVCRVNQVVQNIPAFGKDFGCSLGQNMYPAPEQRCSVWTKD
ncbi:unnamed protein product [Strongylus vulgaris]|uniref:Peptidase M13 C-terminal domain-containing protein n=1 Tax=Strongylus vulgaris TaxID=40348 RepID=A0A3P7LEP6_STRVU|nr:unnamed protein product [Strongylus vulgaris]